MQTTALLNQEDDREIEFIKGGIIDLANWEAIFERTDFFAVVLEIKNYTKKIQLLK